MFGNIWLVSCPKVDCSSSVSYTSFLPILLEVMMVVIGSEMEFVVEEICRHLQATEPVGALIHPNLSRGDPLPPPLQDQVWLPFHNTIVHEMWTPLSAAVVVPEM